MTRDFGDLLATYSSHEKHVFCTSRVKSKTVFKKLFSFPLHHMLFSLSCKPLPLPKPPFSLTKPPFSSSILHQSSRKGMDCLLFSKYFMFLALDFLDFVFLLRFEIMLLEYGLLMFCWVWCMGFVGFGSIILIIHVLHVCFSFLCIIPWLCYVVHIMSMIKCFIDIFLCFCGFNGIQWL